MTHLAARCRLDYPDFRVDVELDVAVEGVTALFGPSGSGKSSLLRLLAGLERAPGNRIEFDGEVWQDGARTFVPPHRRGIGFVFQDARLFPHFSVRANLDYGLKRTPPAERRFGFERVIRVLDLGALLERRPHTLSGGERQRVAIARAVLASPKVLFMDEPLAGLDALRKDEILSFVERLTHELNLPILYVSHALDEVLRLARGLILMSAGRVVATGPLEALTTRLDLRPYTARLDAGAVLRVAVRRHEPARGITRFGFDGVELIGPFTDLPVGAELNLRVRSRDVALSLRPPEGTSILNVLPARVVEIGTDPGPQVHVLLDVGKPLWARIMRQSVQDLGLAPGQPVYALIKAIALDQRSMGRPTAMDLSLEGDGSG